MLATFAGLAEGKHWDFASCSLTLHSVPASTKPLRGLIEQWPVADTQEWRGIDASFDHDASFQYHLDHHEQLPASWVEKKCFCQGDIPPSPALSNACLSWLDPQAKLEVENLISLQGKGTHVFPNRINSWRKSSRNPTGHM